MRLMRLPDALALRRSEAGQRLVEQQHARRAGERQSHVEQALAAVRQRPRLGMFDARQARGSGSAPPCAPSRARCAARRPSR